MKIKLAQYVDVEVPEGATDDEIYAALEKLIEPSGAARRNMDFCIESVDDDDTHGLVDVMVG